MRSTVIPEGMIAKPAGKTSQPKWQKNLFKKMNAPAPQAFMGAILMLSLFMAESWTLGNAPDSTNQGLYAVLLAIFVLFSLETIALSVLQEGYWLSFFFWMDIIGTLSLILDIGWISELFLPQGALSGQGSVIRATRAAKLGARYGRLLRLMRLMKLTRFLPCFASSEEDTYEPTMSAIKKVSEELSAMLSLRTAALTMLLVIVVPFLAYVTTDYSPTAWITNIKMVAKNESTTDYDITNIARKCQHFFVPKDHDLEYLRIESPWTDVFEEEYDTRRVLRHSNIQKYESSYYVPVETLQASSNPWAAHWLANGDTTDRTGYVKFNVDLHMDMTEPNQESSMFGILLILLVIFVLVGFTASYSSSVNRLVVMPLEKMMTTLRSSAMLMINSLKELENANPEDEAKEKEAAAAKQARKDAGEDDSSDEDDDDLEAAQLEKMVAKLSRIVKHVIPNRSIELDENVDKNTSNWLSQAYSSGHAAKKDVHRLRTVTEGNPDGLKTTDIEVTCKITKDVLNSWEFDVLEYSDTDLSDIITFMFNNLNLFNEFQIPRQVFRQFLNDISGRYIKNTYHNYNHGCDVCHTTYRLIMIPQLNQVFTALEVFSLLVGALAHDVGHPGINNLFLVKSKHELALQHNDRSPLENMHCVVLYEILSKKESNIFVGLSESEWRESRKIILTIILGTDMSHHFEQISKTQVFLEVHGEDTKSYCTGGKDVIDCMADDKNRMFIMELVLHCSDISNPFKPYNLCAKWADLVVEEFCLQGDKEKSMGLEVSPMCDRDAISLCNMQMGFIEFVVAPLIIAFVNILPTLHEIGANMGNNFNEWGLRRLRELAPKDGSAKPEEATKLEERLQKFKDRMSFVNGLQALPQRKRTSFLKK